MVTPEPQREADHPRYALDRVRESASSLQVGYTTNVEVQFTNIGYLHEDVCACLAALQPGEFIERLKYPDEPSWYDVYHTKWSVKEGVVDELYIKLKLTGSRVTVFLTAFHPHRWRLRE